MIEKIMHNETVIAIILYKKYYQDGIKFLSPQDYSLQLGYMNRDSGYKIISHIHKPVSRKTVGTQEVLFIKSGKIRANFYSSKKDFLESRELSTGDIILLASGGHSIEVLEKAEIIEVKNGPFIEGADKEKFNDTR